MSAPHLHELQRLRAENEQLKAELASKQHQPRQNDVKSYKGLSFEEHRRYGRQMIVSEFGSLQSQLKLKQCRTLVVGAGGLGCPSLMYLVGAGVGTIGIVDDDVVDETNLHRQVLHSTTSVGRLKCESAKSYLQTLNPNVNITTYPVRLSNKNAFEIFAHFDLVLDCTDAPASRYLINDVAVYFNIPVVSGSGLRTEGQLSVFNYENGPCYRCFYPDPPPANSVTSCSEGGVLGPVIGLLGTAMAVEAIKVITGFYHDNFKPFLTMYSAYPQQTFRVFKMRGRQKTCLCNHITKQAIESIDYSEFCGTLGPVNVLSDEHRISVHDYNSARNSDHVLVDVRPKEQFEVSTFPGAVNIPWDSVLSKTTTIDNIDNVDNVELEKPIYVVCRYGNDSQLATKKLLEMGYNAKDIRGGVSRWYAEVDQNIPFY
ncbi:Adenylyltransferase and sulfurtransferase UBA4 [Meyerozyma sp. JA9]|nr:Adenylyltransferase and sulfurtransferase UBA4 [Meyerozyma sp. JA9]